MGVMGMTLPMASDFAARNVAVEVEPTEEGLLVATSDDEPELFLIEDNEETLIASIKDALSALAGERGEVVHLVDPNPHHPIFRLSAA